MKNVKWKIATLEAKAGLQPVIRRARQMRRSAQNEPSKDPESQAQLVKLKEERIQMKLFALKKYLRKQSKQVMTFLSLNAGKRVKRTKELLESSQSKISEFVSENPDADIPEALAKSHRKLENRIGVMEKQASALKTFNDYEKLVDLFLAKVVVDYKEICSNHFMQSGFFKDKCEVLLMELKDGDDVIKTVYEQINGCKQIQKPLEFAKLDLIACLKEMQDEKRGKEIKNVKRKRDQLLINEKDVPEEMVADEYFEETDEEEQQFNAESEESEQEVDLTGHIVSKKKRNRPGQIARRKQSEERYGTDAKHLINDTEHQKKPYFKIETQNHSQTNQSKPNTSVTDNPEELHPSWQAKLREKQQMQLMAQGPQGKKIVFDDESE